MNTSIHPSSGEIGGGSSSTAIVTGARYGLIMTDDSDPAVSAEELQALFDRAPLEASARGLRVLPSAMKDPDVFFSGPEVSLDDALDVAVAAGAAFVSIEEDFFDAAEFLDVDLDEVPGSIRSASASHDGDRTGVLVRWHVAGTSYTYWAKAIWWRDLQVKLEEWQEDEEDKQDRARRARQARTQELIRAAIADEGIRAAKPTSRKALVEAFIRGQAGPDDGEAAVYARLQCPARVTAAWREAYALLDRTAEHFIADLRELDDWQRVKWKASVRRDVLRRYAISRTGGWAPTDKWVKDMDDRSAPKT